MDQRRLLYWCGDAWKEHLSLMFMSVLLWSGNSVVHRHSGDECFSSSLSLGGILEGYSDSPWVTSEASKVKGKSWTSSRDAIKSTPGTSPPHLGGRTGRDEYGACVGKGQTKSDQERKAFGVTSVYTPI